MQASIICQSIELFSRKRRTTVSAIQSDIYGMLQCLNCFGFVINTTPYHLGWSSLHLLLGTKELHGQSLNFVCSWEKVSRWSNKLNVGLTKNYFHNRLSSRQKFTATTRGASRLAWETRWARPPAPLTPWTCTAASRRKTRQACYSVTRGPASRSFYSASSSEFSSSCLISIQTSGYCKITAKLGPTIPTSWSQTRPITTTGSTTSAAATGPKNITSHLSKFPQGTCL